MQRGAQRADEVSATLSLPLVLLVLAGKARKILRENKHEPEYFKMFILKCALFNFQRPRYSIIAVFSPKDKKAFDK